ncbi:MAG: hypothetical protein R3264_18635 [Anaerolineae bacterium]|nr:hypothetical protein [Anaerolineae bacterium]
MSRSAVLLTGLVGVIGAVIVTGLSILVITGGWIPILVTDPLYGWGIFLFLAAFSIAEIPVMIIGMRRIADSENARARIVALITNAGYTFFAAAYAIPFILLTGRLWSGSALAAFSLVRLISSMVFLPNEK